MEMLDKLNDAGVRAIFAGHWHRNGGGTHKNMQLIVSGPVGMKFLNHDNDVDHRHHSHRLECHRYATGRGCLWHSHC